MRELRLIIVTAVATAALSVPAAVIASDQFNDVPANHTFHDEISWMADTGISEGYPDGTYRPGADVTRGAMSAFMQRLAGQDPDVAPTVNAATLQGATLQDITDQVAANIQVDLETSVHTAPASDVGGYAQCPTHEVEAGYKPIAGGFRTGNYDEYATANYPADSLGWQIVLGDVDESFQPSGTAYVVCARVTTSTN